MLDILIIALIVYAIYKLVNKNKKKKGGSTTTFTPTSTPTSVPASKPEATTKSTPVSKPAAPAKSDSSSDDPFASIDTSAFAGAFAAMEGKSVPTSDDSSAAPASNEAEDRRWVRNHSFTEHICSFYARSWGPDGKIYTKIDAGELPIVRLSLTVGPEGMHEKLYLKEGGDFDSETTFASFEVDGAYSTLDTAAKRDELLKCITERMASLPTISVKNDGFHVITGKSAPQVPETPKAPEAPKAESSDPFGSSGGGFGSVDSAFSGISADAFAQAFAQMDSDSPAPKAPEAPKDEPTPAPATSSDDEDEGDPEMLKAISVGVLGYYHTMWNKDSGALYTELNSTMPIDHFAFQAKETCLVESVWLIGDTVPLVTETPYAKLCADGIADPVLRSAKDRKTLELLLAKYLVSELGTVTLKGNDFYPIR